MQDGEGNRSFVFGVLWGFFLRCDLEVEVFLYIGSQVVLLLDLDLGFFYCSIFLLQGYVFLVVLVLLIFLFTQFVIYCVVLEFLVIVRQVGFGFYNQVLFFGFFRGRTGRLDRVLRMCVLNLCYYKYMKFI